MCTCWKAALHFSMATSSGVPWYSGRSRDRFWNAKGRSSPTISRISCMRKTSMCVCVSVCLCLSLSLCCIHALLPYPKLVGVSGDKRDAWLGRSGVATRENGETNKTPNITKHHKTKPEQVSWSCADRDCTRARVCACVCALLAKQKGPSVRCMPSGRRAWGPKQRSKQLVATVAVASLKQARSQ